MISKRLTREFIQRIKKLGFNQTEMGLLLHKSPRIISFYCCGLKGIPTEVWVNLDKLEKIPRGALCRKVMRARKKK